MSKWKFLAILFTLITFGALKETYRIITSSDYDISSNRSFFNTYVFDIYRCYNIFYN